MMKSSSCQELLLGISKPHIGPLVMEKLTVDGEQQKKQTCKNDQQLYGNEYNYHLLIIEDP